MKLMPIATLLIAAGYLLVCYGKFGLTNSISETRYKWLDVGYSEAFTLFCLVISAGAFVWCLSPLDGPYRDLIRVLIAGAGLAMFFVSVASTFKDPRVDTIHYIFAVLAIGMGFAGIAFLDAGQWFMWVPIVTFGVLTGVTAAFWRDNLTYWVEVYAIAIIFTRLAL